MRVSLALALALALPACNDDATGASDPPRSDGADPTAGVCWSRPVRRRADPRRRAGPGGAILPRALATCSAPTSAGPATIGLLFLAAEGGIGFGSRSTPTTCPSTVTASARSPARRLRRHHRLRRR
ncbi:MAG: hypothetical protein R3F43_09910 [bacterium]